MLFGIGHVPPLLIALYDDGGSSSSFFWAFAHHLIDRILSVAADTPRTARLRVRDGYLITALFWIVLGSLGRFQYVIAQSSYGRDRITVRSFFWPEHDRCHGTDRIDQLPRAILYYRQQLQWLGGMGPVVLAVAIMPMLGVWRHATVSARKCPAHSKTVSSPRIADTA